MEVGVRKGDMQISVGINGWRMMVVLKPWLVMNDINRG